MAARELSDPAEIAAFARRNRWLHLYELGDLDPRFFAHTRFWGIGQPLAALCLLYEGSDPPTLICLSNAMPDAAAAALLTELGRALPRPIYAHLTPGLERCLPGSQQFHGDHWKMGLVAPERLARYEGELDDVEPLGPQHRDELASLYARSTTESWFSAWTLETGFYFGVRHGGALVSVAGVHVVSPEQRVAALGNIATDPAHRGRGLATRATARTCRALTVVVDSIGLNVQADNAAAIACYRKLGFEKIADYRELMLTGSS